MRIPKDVRPRYRTDKVVHRHCQFPGCESVFTIIGGGKDKYCEEHKKKKYRSELYGASKDESAVNDINGKPIHPSEVNLKKKFGGVKAEWVTLNCNCCGKEYKVLGLPSESTYPKYCELHRNEYKRNRYIKELIAKDMFVTTDKYSTPETDVDDLFS